MTETDLRLGQKQVLDRKLDSALGIKLFSQGFSTS